MQITRVTETPYIVKLVREFDTVYHYDVTVLQIKYLQLEVAKTRLGLINKYEDIYVYIYNPGALHSDTEWIKILDDGSLSDTLNDFNRHEEILLEHLMLNKKHSNTETKAE